MKRYYAKYTEAKRAIREAIKESNNVMDNYKSWAIYDLGKQRKIRRYFIGTHLEYINI